MWNIISPRPLFFKFMCFLFVCFLFPWSNWLSDTLVVTVEFCLGGGGFFLRSNNLFKPLINSSILHPKSFHGSINVLWSITLSIQQHSLQVIVLVLPNHWLILWWNHILKVWMYRTMENKNFSYSDKIKDENIFHSSNLSWVTSKQALLMLG